MSKYSVNGTEIIGDDPGLIDWNKIKNAPLKSNINSFTTTYTNCAQGGSISTSTSSVGTDVYLNITMSGGGANYNCLCQC